ncbi:NAC domain-containing protein [Heracleum sosnowskyi]|uniref:NAC domain-containing protein n=1 Tax=Heracleum sosnowskyi TaxID=360622 RepID=A0AAD8ME32_9APIA|nr:NAC domain-containing protein [Heracleum sosnowskyi]
MSMEMTKVLASSSSEKHVDAKVVAEKEIGDNLPPGYYFLPSPSQLIQHYLVQKILGLPVASDIVKIMDSVEHLDPDQLKLDEFKYSRDNEGYYITKKVERKTGVETSIKTTTGHWKESKSNSHIFNKGSQIVGYKNTFTFYQADGKETAWRLNEYTAIPDIVPVDALTDTVQAKIEEYVACRIRFKKVKLPEEIIYDEEIEMDEDED